MVDNRIRGSVQQQSRSGYLAERFDMRVQQTYSEDMDVDEMMQVRRMRPWQSTVNCWFYC